MATENISRTETSLGKRILNGIELARKRMLKEKALLGQSVVVGKDGEAIEVPAAKILADKKEYFDGLGN